MINEMWRLPMLELIDVCSTTRNQQCKIDYMYSKFCHVVFNEMYTYLQQSLSGTKTNRSQMKIHKPFWNDTLTEMWTNMNAAEHNI